MATILVVDDLAANREVLARLLGYKGHRVIEAVDGREALAAVRAHHPDLVITDVLMPVMDGYELLRQLRLDPATSRIPVVFYTAHYGEREARTLALSSGVSFVLTKPVEPETALDVVGRALAGEVDSGLALSPLTTEFDREHLRLLTDKLSSHTSDLAAANSRLRALVNIGLDLASERDSHRLLDNLCAAARELFGASYVTLGILDRTQQTLEHFASHGTDRTNWIQIGDTAPGILQTVVAERRTVRRENSGGRPEALGLPATHPEVQALLAAPMASPAHVYGWIGLAGNEGQRFTEDDEALLTALGGQAGRIYENGYFYAVAERERDRAQRYLDTAEVILLALDSNGRIKQVNRYGCSILGWTAGELLGRDWIDTCIPVRLRAASRRKLGRVLRGSLALFESPVLCRSGEERLIEWRSTLLRDDAGMVTGTFSCGTDVTERLQAIAALRAAEERMHFALVNAGVGIWDMDYRTGVLEWSETLEAQYGLRPGEFAGTFEAFVHLIHPDDRASVLETIGNAANSGADFSIQHRAIWPDGSVRWLNGAGRIHTAHGEPVRAVGISLDVTEQQTLEAQYQQAQKMEAIGRLAGGVAHDFNNLLTVILGYCELLLAELPRDDPRWSDIREIQRAGTRAGALTRQLLAFSRKQIIEPTLLDLNAIAADLRPMLDRLIGADVRIVLDLSPDLAHVKVDRGQIDQVLMNLAVNARDAMPTGGILRIETANLELDEEYARTHPGTTPGDYVALTMTDTGLGMTPEVQARLFEPFFTTKEAGKGTGLGLATVYGIVTRSGGTIDVSTELGRGTSFKMYFPKAEAPEIVDETPVPAARLAGATHRVLVVEDSDELRELARRLLERQGYPVLLAASADEALHLFATNAEIDVLLTDVVMPGASGPELTRHLVEQRPSLKVIYMSGYTEEAIVHHGVMRPGVAFLQKPFTSEALGRTIREVLER